MAVSSSEIVPFDFGFNTVRVILINGAPFFVARDVVVALGYANPREAVRVHCKDSREVTVDTASGRQPVRVIPEADVYRLIMRSKLPSAEQFSDWVVGEVLPSIRKTGTFGKATDSAIDLSNPEFLRSALLEYTEKVIALETKIEQQAPAVEFANAIRDTRDAISVGDMARVLGQGQNRFFARLRSDAILMQDNRPYQRFIDRGYFRVSENVRFDSDGQPHPTFKTLVTGRGQVFLQRRYGVVTEAAV